MREWKTATAPVGQAVAEMNRLESEGYRVTHVFPVNVPIPLTETKDLTPGLRPLVTVSKVYIAAVRDA